MENLGLGAGLAALAFWGFIAAVVVAGIWDNIRKREAQHETIRRLIESGQTIDEVMFERLLSLTNSKGGGRIDRDFQVTGLWLVPISIGLALFAVILGAQEPDAFGPIMGAAALVACIGVGALIAGKIASHWYVETKD